MPPAVTKKADPLLCKALAGLKPGDKLPVILTLVPAPVHPPSSPRPDRAPRQRLAIEAQESFQHETAGLVTELENHGAHNIECQWISQTVSGLLTAEAINAAAGRPEVVRIALVVPRQSTTSREEER